MLPIIPARTDARGKKEKERPVVIPLEGKAGEDNVAWLERATPKLRSLFGQVSKRPLIRLALLGGASPVSFRLRAAQAHLRHDFTPSSWSHVVLLDQDEPSQVYEISLEPRGGFLYPVPTNGFQTGNIANYRDRNLHPNIALIGIPSSTKLTWENIISRFQPFQMQRNALDAIELIVRWLSFVWGAGQTGNPLLEGYGIPSSAMLEIIFSAVGHDLTPGLESRSSCPEAIWQAVKWWRDYYAQAGRKEPHCVYRVDHHLIPEAQKPKGPQPPRPGARSVPTRQHPRGGKKKSRR